MSDCTFSRYGEFRVYYEADSEEEAAEIFDRLTTAAEEIVCGQEGDHECSRPWTCGGETGPLPRGRKEAVADADD